MRRREKGHDDVYTNLDIRIISSVLSKIVNFSAWGILAVAAALASFSLILVALNIYSDPVPLIYFRSVVAIPILSLCFLYGACWYRKSPDALSTGAFTISTAAIFISFTNAMIGHQKGFQPLDIAEADLAARSVLLFVFGAVFLSISLAVFTLGRRHGNSGDSLLICRSQAAAPKQE